MAKDKDKFLNHDGLVKLIGLIKKRINDAVGSIDLSWKSNVFVKDVVGIHTANQQDSVDANVTFVEQSAVVTLGKLDGTGTDTTHNITFTDARYDHVDTSRGAGLMSVEDKIKLDNLGATGASKGANLVKYDSTAAVTTGSVAEAIKNLQGAVGGGDLVKQINTATQESQISGSINYNPNTVRTGNYTKANGDPATFTYYETTYDAATPDTGSGQAIVAGKTGLMSSADKTKLDNLNSSSVPLSDNITVDGTSKSNVQDALTALNTLAAANKSAISTLQSGGLKREIISNAADWPTGTAIKDNVIYMILASIDPLNSGDPSTSATTTPYGTNNNSYNEYMYINNAWERIGSTEVNLDIDPITDDEIDTAWSTTVAAA